MYINCTYFISINIEDLRNVGEHNVKYQRLYIYNVRMKIIKTGM